MGAMTPVTHQKERISLLVLQAVSSLSRSELVDDQFGLRCAALLSQRVFDRGSEFYWNSSLELQQVLLEMTAHVDATG